MRWLNNYTSRCKMKSNPAACKRGVVMAIIIGAWLSAVNAPIQAAERAEEWNYTVTKGDTLIALVERLMKPATEWRRLQQLNRLPNPQRLAPGTVIRIPVAWLRSDATVATVVHGQGFVFVRRGTARLSETPAGTELLPGDQIETGPQSTLAVRFIDGSSIVVAPDSKLLIETLLVYGSTGITETRLKIEEGGVDSLVKPFTNASSRYVVTTPVFNLGVRGTEFRARFDPRTRTAFSEVLEGGVAALGKSRAVRVDAGFGTLAEINSEPKQPIKLLGAPLLRGMPKLTDRVPVSLPWEPEPGATSFRTKLFARAAPERQLFEDVFTKPQARWPDLPDGAYVVQVRSIDADGLEGASATREFVLKARPEAPFVNQPADTAKVYGDEATFGWSESQAAEKYHLQVSGSPDFKTLLLDQKDVVGTKFKFALPPGSYFWRIASVAKGDDHGPFADVFGFVQRKIPEDPGALDAPAVSENEMAFSWKAREPGQTFQYQVSADPQFAATLLDKTTSAPIAKFAKPAPGTYYLRLKTFDADGFGGPFGSAQKFVIEEPPPPPPPPWLMLLPLLLFLI